jgi:ATP-dependent helicase/DNAse subunit B
MISHFSASRIETRVLARSAFATYILKLEPRVEFEVQAIDFGNLHHKLLEELYKQLIDDRRSWTNWTRKRSRCAWPI